MASYASTLPRLHEFWLASLAGPQSTILSLQKSLLRTVLELSLPSALSEKISATIFLNIALLHAFDGSLALASINFEAAIARSRHCALAHFGLGLTRFLLARDADAIQAWETCVACFEITAPEGIQAGEWMGTENIAYQMWRLGEYGEEYQSRWILAKNAVQWNLYVMDQRLQENNRLDNKNDLNESKETLFVQGIPAGMLFGPPSDLRQGIYVQSEELNERQRQRPTEKSDPHHAWAHIDDDAVSLHDRLISAIPVPQVAPVSIQDRRPTEKNHPHHTRAHIDDDAVSLHDESTSAIPVPQVAPVSLQDRRPTGKNHPHHTRAHIDDDAVSLHDKSTSANPVPQVAPVSLQDRRQPKPVQDHPQLRPSPLTLKIKKKEQQNLTTYRDLGKSSTDLSYGGQQAVHSENRDGVRLNAATFQRAVTSTKDNPQANMMTSSSHVRRHHDGYRALNDVAPSSTFEGEKAHPSVPHLLEGISNQTSRHGLPSKLQKSPSTPTPSRTLSTKAGSLARFFSKSKPSRHDRDIKNRTDSDIIAGTDTDTGADTGFGFGHGMGVSSSSLISSHSTSRDFTSSGSNTPFDEDDRGKDKVFRHGRSTSSTQRSSAQSSHGGQPLNIAFVEADMQPRFMGTGLSGQVEWEMNMGQRVADKLKTPKPLKFPREEINRKAEGKSGIGIGLGSGSSSKAIGTMNNQNFSQPLPLQIPHTAPAHNTSFEKGGSGGSGHSRNISRGESGRVRHFNDQRGPDVEAAYSLPRSTTRPGIRVVPDSHLDVNYDPAGAASSVPAYPLRTSSLPVELSISAPSYSASPSHQRMQRQQRLRRETPLSQLGHELEWDDQEGDFKVRDDERKGERDDSKNSSIKTRTRDQNSRRGAEANEGETSRTIVTSPLEMGGRIHSDHLRSHSHNRTIAKTKHAYPTSIPPGYGNEKAAKRTSESSSIEDAPRGDERHSITSSGVFARSVSPIAESATYLAEHHHNAAAAAVAMMTTPHGIGSRSASRAATHDEVSEEEEQEIDDAEQRRRRRRRGEEEEGRGSGEPGLLNSAVFPGFQDGVNGLWYKGQWI